MKCKKIFLSLMLMTVTFSVFSQVENAGGVRRRSDKDKKEASATPGVTERMQGFYQTKPTHDADLSYMKEVYRQLNLENGPNAALYYPEDVIDGQENLFRIIFRLVMDGKIPAYEYLDGREIFTDQYKLNAGDILSRFGIYGQPAKGSTEKNPKYLVEESDVPTGQVLNYYIIEKWEFDRRSNSMKTTVEAICPVLNRYGDYGGEAKYPMFWVKFDELRPYLAQQYVFISDDNNIPQYSLDDYFNLGLYDGEIYKTRNLRNQSLAQMFPDEDEMKHAQDSIDNHLRNFGKNLWVPTREEYLAQREKEAGKKNKTEASQGLPERTDENDNSAAETVVISDDVEQEYDAAVSSRAKKKTKVKKTNTKKPKSVSSSSSGANAAAEKSVRRRKR